MERQNYLKIGETRNISRKNKIYYTNTQNDNDDINEDDYNANNDFEHDLNASIIDDQIINLKKKNHFIKNSLVLIDSKNRDTYDKISSSYIKYEKIALLFNNNYSGLLFFTLYEELLNDGDTILFEQIYIDNENQLIDKINNVNLNVLTYDMPLNEPLFTITEYTNTKILDIFGWNTLYPIIKDKMTDEVEFSNKNEKLFYSIRFSFEETYTNANFVYMSTKKNVIIKKVNTSKKGFPISSYYKVPLSHKLFNIYKIKLIDIKLPLIFNINSTEYKTNSYSFNINAYFKIIIKSNNFNVSSLDYISNKIQYNYFNRIALYDKSGAFNNIYSANLTENKYVGTSIINIMNNLLNINSNNNNFINNFIDKYGFQLAYYLLYTYITYNNTYDFKNDLNYYVITLDFFENLNNKLIKKTNILNNKMPLIYYNNAILYVNNDTYIISLYEISIFNVYELYDKINGNIHGEHKNVELYLENLTPNPIIGYITEFHPVDYKYSPYYIFYNIKFKPLLSSTNFNPEDIINLSISNLIKNENKIINTIYEYIEYEPSDNTYIFKVKYLYEDYEQWGINDKLYHEDIEIGTIEAFIYDLVIYIPDEQNIEFNLDDKFSIDNETYGKIYFSIYKYNNLDNSDKYKHHLKYFPKLKVFDIIIYSNYVEMFENTNMIKLNLELKGSPIMNELNICIGSYYIIGYTPIRYNIIFEKIKDFDNINYLQNNDIILKRFLGRYTNLFPGVYSHLSSSPIRTSKHNLESYNVYPTYDIELTNGYYNDLELTDLIEDKFNSINIKKYDHIKKDFVVNDKNKNILNEPNYNESIFKKKYNSSTREFSISAYQKNNILKYRAFYNIINPYLFIQSNNCIQNNERIFIEVNDIIDKDLIEITNKYFNDEITARILPTYTYSLRLISPVPNTSELKYNKIYENIDNLLNQINLNAYQYVTSFPNLNTKLKNIGIALINNYNNSYVLNSEGEILEKKGIACLLNDFELCICITNINTNMESYKLGRVVKISDKTSNSQGNFKVRFQMTGNTSQSFPFYIGDIIYSIESKQIFCIVPNEWGTYMDNEEIRKIHNSLPSKDIIRNGYINYLKYLYLNSGDFYLLDNINDFNLNKYNQAGFGNMKKPWNIWFIQEEFNAHYGFEIYFDYRKDLKFNDTQLKLSFLKCEQFCAFFEDSKSPKDIMGISYKYDKKIIDYQNTNIEVPFYHTLSNLKEVNVKNINEFYFTYGSDSKLNNKLYVNINSVSGFNIGDTIFFENLKIKQKYLRNLFNIRKTVNHSINKIINFEMYINTIIYRLAFIKLGIPLPNGSNDLTVDPFNDSIQSTLSNQQVNIAAENINNLLSDKVYLNYIKEIYINELKEGSICDLNNLLINNQNITSSEIISETIIDIREKILFNRILSWFIKFETLQKITIGNQNEYSYLLGKYYYIKNSPKIYRLELKINDDLFIFVKNLEIYDIDNNKIGIIIDTSLYSEYKPETGLIYHIYINLDPSYNNDLFLNASPDFKTKKNPEHILESEFNIYTKYYNLDNNDRHKNSMNIKPTVITNDNNALYMYETYLRFKVIINANPNNNLNDNNTLDFNIPNSITSTYNNLFNIDNNEIDIFKNGYYLFISNNIIDDNINLFNDTYQTSISLLDNKNIFAICNELGILPDINDIMSIKNYIDEEIKNVEQNKENININIKKLSLLSKQYIDILQILVDFPVQFTFMIKQDWSNDLELESLNTFKYKLRRMECIIPILGNNNFYLNNMSYKPEFIFGDNKTKRASEKTYNKNRSDVNVFFNNLFINIISDQEIEKKQKENKLSDLFYYNEINNRYQKLINSTTSYFDSEITLFNAINVIYGFVFLGTNIDSKTGLNSRIIWVIFPNYVFQNNLLFNDSNLENFLITINFLFIDQNKDYNVSIIEYNQNVDNNIIFSAIPEVNSEYNGNYRIFKIGLKFTPKYPIVRGTTICIKDYYTQLYKKNKEDKIKNNNIIYIKKNWTNQITLSKNDVIHINMGSHNLLYRTYINKQIEFSRSIDDYQIDNFTNEEINIIKEVEEQTLEDETIVIKCTLNNIIRFEFADEIPVIIRFAPVYKKTPITSGGEQIKSYNQNTININLLSTIPILINNEWYTRIYYSSSPCLDIYELSTTGNKAFQNSSKRKIYISGMQGFIQPNVGFQKEERTYIFNSATKEEESFNKFIKPVPNGEYFIEYFQKEDGFEFMQDGFTTINVPGFHKQVLNMNSPEQDEEWIDYYINFIKIKFKCNKPDLIIKSEKDYKEILEKKTGIFLYKLIKVVSIDYTYEDVDEEMPYLYYFYLEITSTFDNYILFNNTSIIIDREKTFEAISLDNSFNIGNSKVGAFNNTIDYEYVSNFTNSSNNYILIKGKYLGFGGEISNLNDNDIFNQIPYEISHINKNYNQIEIDLEFSKNIYSFYYRNNNINVQDNNLGISNTNNINYKHRAISKEHINPAFANFEDINEFAITETGSNELRSSTIFDFTSKYDIYPIKYNSIGSEGTVFKKNINKPFSADIQDYIFLCINNIDNNVITEQQNAINNKIILAKIYINKDINNIDLQVRHYEVVFDLKLLPSIEELEILYIDKNGNLVNFNNLDNNFTLEISQYLERVKNINTKNGMVY